MTRKKIIDCHTNNSNIEEELMGDMKLNEYTMLHLVGRLKVH